MPTGYTESITRNPEFTFRQYLLGCARAFGAAVQQRDEPVSAPLRLPELSDYYLRKFESASAELADLDAKSDEDLLVEMKKVNQASLDDHQRTVAEMAHSKARYEAFLAQALTWTPPTEEHQNLKQFMLSQIKESMDFDLHTPREPYLYEFVQGFRAEMRGVAVQSLAFAEHQWAKDQATHASRCKWIQALHDSLAE